jgi:hypothetical protein
MEENKDSSTPKFGKFGEFVKKYKIYIIGAFTAIVGYIAGDSSLQDAITSLFK